MALIFFLFRLFPLSVANLNPNRGRENFQLPIFPFNGGRQIGLPFPLNFTLYPGRAK